MADQYGQKYLGTEDALFADRSPLLSFFRTLRALAGVFGAGALALGGAAAFGSKTLGAAVAMGVVAAACMALGVLFGVVRTVVKPSELSLAVGLIELRIPMDAIADVAVAEPDALRAQAVKATGEDFGASLSPGPAVRITWVDDGRERASWVASRQPERLAEAIQQARAPGLRIEVGEEASSHQPHADDIALAEQASSEIDPQRARRT